MKYKDLFIDFDDTLYDTRGNAIIALKEVYDSMQLAKMLTSEQLFYEEYWKANISLWGQYGKGEIDRDYLIVERFRRPLFLTAREPFKAMFETPLLSGAGGGLEFCLKVSDTFLDYCSDKPGVVDGAHEVMDYLKTRGYRMHICSNGFHEVQYKKLRACGLIDYFDTIILSEDAGVNKPSTKFFDYALMMSGAEKSSTLMIGDNYYSDIIGALDSGIDAMLFQRWDQSFIPPREVKFIVPSLLSIKDVL